MSSPSSDASTRSKRNRFVARIRESRRRLALKRAAERELEKLLPVERLALQRRGYADFKRSHRRNPQHAHTRRSPQLARRVAFPRHTGVDECAHAHTAIAGHSGEREQEFGVAEQLVAAASGVALD